MGRIKAVVDENRHASMLQEGVPVVSSAPLWVPPTSPGWGAPAKFGSRLAFALQESNLIGYGLGRKDQMTTLTLVVNERELSTIRAAPLSSCCKSRWICSLKTSLRCCGSRGLR